ncbi:MAG: hypothetical protein ACYDBT_17730 [Desulfobulbaceae bacterium]
MVDAGFFVFIIFGFICGFLVYYYFFREEKPEEGNLGDIFTIGSNLFNIAKFIFLSFFVPTLGSVAYNFLSEKTFKEFVYYGVCTIVLSVATYFLVYFFDKKVQKLNSDDKKINIFVILSQVVPYTLIYVLTSLLLSGFSLPFK